MAETTDASTTFVSAKIMYAVVERAADILRPSAETEKVEDCHWISDSDNYPEDYCYACASAIVAKGITDSVHGDLATVDGGWRAEHDSPPYCECCGARLDYSPTGYCTSEEIGHFFDFWNDYIPAGTALDLLNIFDAICDPIHYVWCANDSARADEYRRLTDAFVLAERVISSVVFATSGMDRRTAWSFAR